RTTQASQRPGRSTQTFHPQAEDQKERTYHMDSLIPSTLKIDKTALSLVPCFDTSDEKLYWLSRTPTERLQHIEVLRRINYGHHASAPLQRTFEHAQYVR